MSENFTKELPRPGREKRWSWVIMVASGFTQGMSFSLSMVMGAFYMEWQKMFDVSREVAAIPLSINIGMMLVLSE